MSDVAGSGGAEERVGDGVEYGVGIRVAGEAAGVADANAAEDQRARVVECMNVDALSDSNHCPPHSARMRSAITRSSGRVILKFSESPFTALTV